MKICLVGTLPDAGRDALRGPERTTIGLAEALSDRGHDVTVVADEGDGTTVNTESVVFPIRSRPGVARTLELSARIVASLNIGRYDIVHSWRPALCVDVLSLHGVGMAEQVEAAFPGTFSRTFVWGAKVDRWGKRITARGADHVVSTAPRNTEDARRYGIDPTREVPVGVEAEFLQQDESTDENAIDVFYAARMEVRKQPHFVASETPDEYRTIVAGPASDTAYLEANPQLEAEWVGMLPHGSLLDAYRRARVFVLPSYFEPFGLNAAEAMAAHTPVVAADTTALSDLVEIHNLGTVFEFGHGDSYRDALSRCFDDRETYARNARIFAEEKLSWGSIAETYEEIYRDSI